MDEYLKRIEVLIGEEKLRKIRSKTVMVCGTGGVGSFVCEALARSGIGKLIIVDCDVIDSSNLNRQLLSQRSNIGAVKVIEEKKRIEAISDCDVIAIDQKIDEHFLVENCDYVVDCIDDLKAKFALVKQCHEKGIPVLSSLGTAKRMSPKGIQRTTLAKTRNDPLAKAFRNLVKKEDYRKKIDVVFIDSPPIPCKELGSSIFAVGSAGLWIAAEVFNDLLKEEQNENSDQ